MAKKSQIAAGKLQILGLDKIRDQMGPRWNAVSDKVDLIVERILKKRLAPVDHYTKYDDEAYPAYVVLFGELEKDEAQFKCALIAKEIAEAVLGTDAAPDTVEVKTVVAMVEGASIAEDVSALDAIGRILAQEAERLDASSDGPDEAEPSDVEPEPSGVIPEKLGFVYQPVWDVRRNVIVTFRCVPVDRSTATRTLTGYDILGPATPEPGSFADLDMRVMEHVTSEYQRLRKQNQRRLLATCVHFKTLADHQHRHRYLGLYRALPDSVRHDIVLELTGLPEDLVRRRLAEQVQLLRPHCRALHVEMGSGPQGLEIFRGLGVEAVGLDLSHSHHSERDLITAMNRFVSDANDLKIGTFIRGLGTKSLTMAAVGAGFDYIDGVAVFPAIEMLGDAYRFKPTDLFAHLMAPKT